MAGSTKTGCCVFLPAFSRTGYRMLALEDGYDSDDAAAVTVVVGKERKVFAVSPFLLKSDPFKILIEEVGKGVRGDAIFVDVDSILFEHLLWLASKNECPALLRMNLKEIVEFYSQDL